jgi:two-component system, cell cycle sensor histidine kinase and response regulator CckA
MAQYSQKPISDAERRLGELLENAPDAILELDNEGRIVLLNRMAEQLFGYTREELLGQTVEALVPEALREAHKRHRVQYLNQPVTRPMGSGLKLEARRKDGSHFPVEISLSPVKYQTGFRVTAIIRDITERRQIEEALRSSEERLRHAQKMEAIGRLAGGVAHDFNNLLTGILGYSELLLAGVGVGDPLQEGLQEIKKAANRAASLTHQLLAFSRRQVLQPKVLTLNSVVADLERMLRRLIGEHIELFIASDEPLEPVLADPGQISQVIMNLALNARDAMLGGGTLSIETRNADLDEMSAAQQDIEPGRYVMLVVSDTGIGIDPDAQAHLFEPFFTTKDKALGTGLGLATVYGIVEQSGAKMHFSSELGRGTSFKIFFPRVAERAERSEGPSGALAAVPRGSEVVLLVEDEETVRRLTRTFLENIGYRVLDARHGGEGIALCRNHQGPIHLLLTDVLMPKLNGRELAEQATLLHPEMKVLFMSGYTDDALIGEDIKAQGAPFLQKPFTLQELGRKVRDLLDSTAEAFHVAGPRA